MPTHNLRMEEFSMKKLLIVSLLAAVAAFGVSAAEPLGVEVGVDFGISGFEADSDLGATAKPFAAYKRNFAGVDTKTTLSYDFPVYEDFKADKGTFGAKVYGSKSFTLNETFTLTPGLTVRYSYDTAKDDDQSKFGIDPEATLGYGKYYTLLQGIATFVPDSTFDLYLEEGGSFGAFSPYVYGQYAFNPDSELAYLGFGVSYSVKAWTFLADGSWGGFGDGDDVAYSQLLRVKYSF
jgi:hypothetical protein